MSQRLLRTSSPFRPSDEEFPPETKSQIQLHRLLTLLGVFLIPTLGLLYHTYNPLAVDMAWARLVITSLFAGLLGASYWIKAVRSNYVKLLRALCYLLLSWTILLAFLNHFSGDYVAGLLLVYAALIVVIGLGAHTARPVIRFSGVGLLLTTPAITFSLAPYTNPLVLLASMGTVALVEGITIHGYLSTRKQTREREKRMRGLANSVPGVVFQFVVSPDGSLGTSFVGDYAEAVLGISSATDRFYERVLDHVPRTHREKLVESIDRAVEETEARRVEMPFEKPSGKRLWLLCNCIPERRGKETVLNGVLLDITERKRAEQAVRDREQKAEALYAATERLLTASSRKEVASRLEELIWAAFDYPLVGVHFVREHMLVPVAVSPNVSEQMPGGSSSNLETSDLDGGSLRAQAYRSGETTVAPDLRDVETSLDYGDLRSGACVPIGSYGVISIADAAVNGVEKFDVRLVELLAAYAVAVLDRIDREEELVEAKEEAEEASRLKSAMLANMSHEIRTPLTAITGFAEILKTRLTGVRAEFSARIHRNGQRLTKTLDSVLQFSKLEAGAYELDWETVDLSRVAEETVGLRRQDADNEAVTLHRELPASPVEGRWNEGVVRRILENLLENALKFTPEGGTVTVRVAQADAHALLEVEDTGIGISEEALPEVFEAFQQESEGLDRTYEGSGLGLSIVKELVDALGGDIEIESTKGEGTRITVSLPLQRDGGAG